MISARSEPAGGPPSPFGAMHRSFKPAECALLCLLFIAYVFLQVRPLLQQGGMVSHQNDFKHIYLGAMLLSEGENPYDDKTLMRAAADSVGEDPRFGSILPYVYLPFTGLVLKPLTLLPFRNAVLAWMLLNHAMILGGCALLAWAMARERFVSALNICLCCLPLFIPLFRQTNAGQLNGVLFLGYALVAWAFKTGRHPALVGGIAAFLALFKLSPGLLLIWFLLSRRWREGAWMLACGVAGMAWTMALYGWRIHAAFLPLLRDMGMGRSTWAEHGQTFFRDPYNISINSFFHRVLAPGGGHAAGADVLTYLVALPLLAGFCWVTWKRGSNLATLALAIATSLLVPSLCWDHYLVQALVPVLVLLLPDSGWRERWIPVLLLAVMSVNIEYQSGAVRSFTLGATFGQVPEAALQTPLVQFLLSFKTAALLGLHALAASKACQPVPASPPPPH